MSPHSNSGLDIAPWKQIAELVASGDAEGLQAVCIEQGPREVARALGRLSEEDQQFLLTHLDEAIISQLFEEMADVQAAGLVVHMEPAEAATIIEEMGSSAAADLLGELDEARAEQIIAAMEPEAARHARLLTQYDDHVAGGLMVTEYLSYPASLTVNQVVEDMRSQKEKYKGYDVQYAYVLDEELRLAGVLVLRDLLLEPSGRHLSGIMRANPVHVIDQDSLEELEAFFESHSYLAVPVTNVEGKMLGVVTRRAVQEAAGDRADDMYLKSQGIMGGEELRSMPLLVRSYRRLSWLSINIVLNMIAASVIAFYEETLSAVIALAVFIPIISDMSGCSGNQAVAVTMRELTLGLIKPVDLFYVWSKEVTLGIINGIALGLLVALLAWVWKGNPYLGIVAGGALAMNTVIAVSIGGLIPLALKRMKMDPALAAGPILTTVTDMCGFFLVLSLASAMLPYLT